MRRARIASILWGAALLAGCSRNEPPPPGPVPPPESPPAQFDPWQNARERGIDFRATGQEPGWFVEVDHEKGMRLVWDYATQSAVTAEPLQPSLVEGTTMYRAAAGTHQVEVAIESSPCSDAMSGQSFPKTVTVNVDGRALRGCGRELK